MKMVLAWMWIVVCAALGLVLITFYLIDTWPALLMLLGIATMLGGIAGFFWVTDWAIGVIDNRERKPISGGTDQWSSHDM